MFQDHGKPRIFVLAACRAVTELGPDDKVLATHKLDLPKQEFLGFLRTGVGADGKRFFLASMRGMQQVHLFDENWKSVLHFPKARWTPTAVTKASAMPCSTTWTPTAS